MKITQLHTTALFRFLLILSGVVLFAFLPLDTDSGEYEFSNIFQYETEFDLVNDRNSSEGKDANHSNHIFELAFKETIEEKDSFAGTNGLAVLKQGTHYPEVVFAHFSIDRSYLYNGLKLLTKEDCSDFVRCTSHHLFSYLLSLTGDIAINAP